MENMHYTKIMVKDTPQWQQDVGKLVEGENVTARLQKKQKNGLLILIGSTDKDALKRVIDKSIYA